MHDQAVADDYYLAMSRVEQRLDLFAEPETSLAPIPGIERKQLLTLASRLVEPELATPERLELIGFMQALLNGRQMAGDWGWGRPPPVPDIVAAI